MTQQGNGPDEDVDAVLAVSLETIRQASRQTSSISRLAISGGPSFVDTRKRGKRAKRSSQASYIGSSKGGSIG